MHTRIAVVVGILIGALPAVVAAQNVVPIDQWHGEVAGRVVQVEGQVVTLDGNRAYRYRGDTLADAVALGDDVRLHRDYIRNGDVVHGMRWSAFRSRGGGSVILSEGTGLAAARAKCRADWPANFVMQRYCIEQQEEAYRDLQRRGR